MAELHKIVLASVHYPYGVHVSRSARESFGVVALEASASNETLRVHVARGLVAQLNTNSDQAVAAPTRVGELLRAGLLMDVLRYVAYSYCTKYFPDVAKKGMDWSRVRWGNDSVDSAVSSFVELYPPASVACGEQKAASFLTDATGGVTHEEVAGIEMLLLRLSNANAALARYKPLFDEDELAAQSEYVSFNDHLGAYLETQPPFPGTNLSLMAVLRHPMEMCPDSLEGQLDYIVTHWKAFLPEALLSELERQLVLARDILEEETAARGPGPGPLSVLAYGKDTLGYDEPEAFSVDAAWMPNVVLIAKCVYVWLDQLSKAYRRRIARLDEIPDAALDQLGEWGFTGLWLIGIWERSRASQTIKEIMGNPEAASSAYSLYDYVIAKDLGGEEAYENLAGRAWERGIRLASDMVPNHVGIYSRWIVEHPDWFIQSSQPPFPGYAFSGANLSGDDRVGVYLEDGYWEHRDAAVVFKRVDRWTGETRYIYHGNDGTSMPWNDTAQLDFMNPAVREAVIETILHVARQFPIIRFDAAMTLTKKHFQRLWFPAPGEGGAIPSRAEHGMVRDVFDGAFPAEFWREVVDRVAVEAPDTLLLAEAFWLMEGFFVRTLGMHRVYNSAFMNMLKEEDNANYRQTIKNVLEYSPEILQRFVNFMNNPDEETAEAQFGKGDKYFGVTALLVTMPGLPMFGHGQIEGYKEKYGMEYRRAYWNESVDDALVARHAREIFPLVKKRYLFSGATHFALFDFVAPEGHVNENVFAYSNRSGDERALVVYNNAYERARGVLHTSTAINRGTAEEKALVRVSLSDALGLDVSGSCYYIFRDSRTGLEALMRGAALAKEGFHLDLAGYQYHVFLDWREVHDLDGSWEKLHAVLRGDFVPDVMEAYEEMHLAPVLEPFRKVFQGGMLARLGAMAAGNGIEQEFRDGMRDFLAAVGVRLGNRVDTESILDAIERDLSSLRTVHSEVVEGTLYPETAVFFGKLLPKHGSFPLLFWRVPLAWAAVRHLGLAAVMPPEDGTVESSATLDSANTIEVAQVSARWLQEWFLMKHIAKTFVALQDDAWRADMDARLVRICVAHSGRLGALHREIWGPILDAIFEDVDVKVFLQLNRYSGRRYINKEQLERMLNMLLLTVALRQLSEGGLDRDGLALCVENVAVLLDSASDAAYDLDSMVASLR